jgi:DNA-binding MarR family transcriptional regulator
MPRTTSRMLPCPLSGPAQEGAPLNDEIEDWMTEALLRAIAALVRREGAALSARQIGVFLICHLEEEAQTVRGLAAKLNISTTAVCRALNRLCEFDLVRRKTDPLDRRSVLVQRTTIGAGFLRDLQRIFADAANEAESKPAQMRRSVASAVS